MVNKLSMKNAGKRFVKTNVVNQLACFGNSMVKLGKKRLVLNKGATVHKSSELVKKIFRILSMRR